MAFIDRVIGKDEKLISRGNPHWIYILQGFLLLALFLILGHFLNLAVQDYIRDQLVLGNETQLLWILFQIKNYIFYGCVMLGLFVFLLHFIYYRSTHVAITSDRLIFKTGMFFVDLHESALEEIKGAQVHNGFFGRFLDYGFIQVDCRFVDNMNLPAISRPYAFLHELHELMERSARRKAAVAAEDLKGII